MRIDELPLSLITQVLGYAIMIGYIYNQHKENGRRVEALEKQVSYLQKDLWTIMGKLDVFMKLKSKDDE